MGFLTSGNPQAPPSRYCDLLSSSNIVDPADVRHDITDLCEEVWQGRCLGPIGKKVCKAHVGKVASRGEQDAEVREAGEDRRRLE